VAAAQRLFELEVLEPGAAGHEADAGEAPPVLASDKVAGT
jgi:hypothetical protein